MCSRAHVQVLEFGSNAGVCGVPAHRVAKAGDLCNIYGSNTFITATCTANFTVSKLHPCHVIDQHIASALSACIVDHLSKASVSLPLSLSYSFAIAGRISFLLQSACTTCKPCRSHPQELPWLLGPPLVLFRLPLSPLQPVAQLQQVS